MKKDFLQFGVAPNLLVNIEDAGYQEPTEIQRKVIPPLLAGKDVLATAQTGTGKTAAFVLPLVSILLKNMKPKQPKAVRALILTPTRELTVQVMESVCMLTKGLGLEVLAVYGGSNIDRQKRMLQKGVDIVVATPGRLNDLIGQKSLSLQNITDVVLDEADRMLDMGFIFQIRKILNLIPKPRRVSMFSATFPESVKKLAKEFLRNPTVVEVSNNSRAASVEQQFFRVIERGKHIALRNLVVDNGWRQVLVFCRTKSGAEFLTNELTKDGFSVDSIHGDKTQAARLKALDSFKDNKSQILVATDVAARGLDIQMLPCIVNYELPQNAEDFVHRIGRTGRAGSEGLAVTLISEDEVEYFKNIEKFLKETFTVQEIPLDVDVFPNEMLERPTQKRGTNKKRNERFKEKISK